MIKKESIPARDKIRVKAKVDARPAITGARARILAKAKADAPLTSVHKKSSNCSFLSSASLNFLMPDRAPLAQFCGALSSADLAHTTASVRSYLLVTTAN
jgi:hypothetical protein